MAIALNGQLLESVLSNYHTFIPKITLMDRARVRQVSSPEPVSLPFENSTYTVEEETFTAEHIFDSITFNNTDFIFAASKLMNENGVHTSGPLFNEIYYTTRKNDTFAEITKLDLSFNVDFISCFEVYYNSNCGQFGLVYSGYCYENERWRNKTFLKRLMLNNISEEDAEPVYTITQYDETLIFFGSEFFTCSCLDDSSLIIVSKTWGESEKAWYKLSLLEPTLADEDGRIIKELLETETTTANGNIRNLKSCNVENTFYYIEAIEYLGGYQTNIYDTYIFGYSPYVSSNIYNDIFYTGDSFKLTSSTEDGRYVLYTTNTSFQITEEIPINGEPLGDAVFNSCNYLYFGNFVVFDTYGTDGMYLQSSTYEITYREENTEFEIPRERIISVEYEDVFDNMKSRPLSLNLNNDDGFFTLYGQDNTGFDFKNYFNTKRISLRQLRFYIGDNDARDTENNVIYECLYTGFLRTPTDKGKGVLSVPCVDGLGILKDAYCRPKTYSMIQGEEYVKDLMKQAGFEEVIFDVPLHYTIEKIELDRRQNVLDSVKKILDVCEANMYFDRFGIPHVDQRLMYKENIFNLTDRHITAVDGLDQPSVEYVRNIVRIITDNEKDLYVEARDQEAVDNMGYECPMELDYTGLFTRPKSEKEEDYTYPTTNEIKAVIQDLYPVAAANPLVIDHCDSSCGKFPWHARYLYAVNVIWEVHPNEYSPQTYFVSADSELYFKQQGGLVYACQTNNTMPTMINYLLATDDGAIDHTYAPQNTPFYGGPISFENSTLAGVTKIFPNSTYFPQKRYEKFPDRVYKNFRTDLIEHFKVNCQIPLTSTEEDIINDFLDTYANSNYELVYWAEAVSGKPYPCAYWYVIAVEKDYTYFEDIPETMMAMVKRKNGRYRWLESKDGVAKNYHYINRYCATQGVQHSSGVSFDFDNQQGYGMIDFAWHKTTDAVVNGISAQDVANRILKQVCRTVEFETYRTVPLFFLTPNDIIYLYTNKKKGYRQIKQFKHTFNFANTRNRLYDNTVKLQDATEGVDFFLIDNEEVSDG